MAKEPQLLAEIRANAARTEKAAKSSRTAPPPDTGPQFVGTVETPARAATPNNYIAEALADCMTAEHCEALLAHAKQHRYSEDGQTVQAIRKRMAELHGGTAKPAKLTAGKRGAR